MTSILTLSPCHVYRHFAGIMCLGISLCLEGKIEGKKHSTLFDQLKKHIFTLLLFLLYYFIKIYYFKSFI